MELSLQNIIDGTLEEFKDFFCCDMCHKRYTSLKEANKCSSSDWYSLSPEARENW